MEKLRTMNELEGTSKNDPRAVVDGVVEHGDKRGRLLGFPTANVTAEAAAVEDGVWAGTFQLAPDAGGAVHVAAISLGTRPTYYGAEGARLLEVFLLDFAGDLYGVAVRVAFHERIRPQERFESEAALVEQLSRDVEAVRAWSRQDADEGDSTRPGRRGWGPSQRRRSRDRNEAHVLRERRRAAAVLESIVACPAEHLLSFEWVSSWTGLRTEYLRWRYPTLDDLKSLRQGRFDAPRDPSALTEAG